MATSSRDEEGIVRLIDVADATLEEFQATVKQLLPKNGKPIRSLEVYLGHLRAAQLAHLFDLLV